MSAQPEYRMTPTQYLTFERASIQRHEYIDGQIYALAGGSQQHSLIITNLVASLHGQLCRRDSTVYANDMRIRTPQTTFYTYPDVSVVCGRPLFEDDSRDILLNPIVIIEVLSPSTERYDRGRKFRSYRLIETLREYILIAQDTRQIEHFERQPDGQWTFQSIGEEDPPLALPSIGCMLSVADVYEKVEFDTP